MKDLKYLAALTLPLTALIGLYLKDYWAFLTPVYAFVIIPLFELLLPQDNHNYIDQEREERKEKRLFDWMLYLNVPIVFGLLWMMLNAVAFHAHSAVEIVGLIFSMGIVLGTNGINVAHELGHRSTGAERLLGKLLLLPSLYMHFYIEHNFGHHAHAATKEDPATARFNQSVFSFWITSVSRQYISAWKIQRSLLTAENTSFLSIKNDMLWYVLFQSTYLMLVYFVFGPMALLFAIIAGILGFLLLETVNYIEHYGLARQKNPSGRYERMREVHSWNSNHVVGRIVLYELTRHSDHHYKSSKKYQLLDNHDHAPQMPFGYPTSMVIALVPSLWFKIMNPRVPQEMRSI